MAIVRAAKRAHDQIRPVRIHSDSYGYATASILFQMGNTKVLCAVDMQPGVPAFLRGKKTGWLKAEYAMLPTSTTIRSAREMSACSRNGRLVEISRLIGRVLRSSINLDVIGERTITVDCDVLQADGGTRTACITGASLALYCAAQRWKEAGDITGELIRERLGALSVGVMKDTLLLDLDCAEDTSIEADFNFVLTQSGSIVEIQGTAEAHPIPWQQFTAMCTLATQGIQDLFAQIQDQPILAAATTQDKVRQNNAQNNTQKVPLFSLANRMKRNHVGTLDLS